MPANVPIELVRKHLPQLTSVAYKGSGAFKCTFSAEWNGRLVAVQVHDPAHVHPDRLDRERAAMLAVDSSYVVKLFEVTEFHDSGQQYPVFICEYVEGQTLLDVVLNGGRFQGADGDRLARELLAGLAAIHDRRLIHRDLKPENVMIRATGEAVILDLGVAKHLDKVTLTPAGFQPGTRIWMAPEQLRGEKHLDARADLFALGIVLYFAATGSYPFTGPDNTLAIMQQDVVSLATSHAGIVSAQLSDLIEKLLQKEPFRRPRSAQRANAELP